MPWGSNMHHLYAHAAVPSGSMGDHHSAVPHCACLRALRLELLARFVPGYACLLPTEHVVPAHSEASVGQATGSICCSKLHALGYPYGTIPQLVQNLKSPTPV